MNDFKRIRYAGKLIGIYHYNQTHTAAMNFLNSAVRAAPTKKQVVVSHHLPSERCNAPEFQGSAINEAFCVDLTSLIRALSIDVWIYGHSHRNIPEFDIESIPTLTNNLGYVQLGEHGSFRKYACLGISL